MAILVRIFVVEFETLLSSLRLYCQNTAAWMQADPDYRQIAESEVGRNYVKDKERLAAEALAYVLSAAYAKMGYKGFGALNRARGFAERCLGEVASLYGIKAVKQFRDIDRQMAVSVERVVDQYGRDKTQRTVPRRRGRTKGPDGRGFETSCGADSISEQERAALREYIREAWKGRETSKNAARPANRPRKQQCRVRYRSLSTVCFQSDIFRNPIQARTLLRPNRTRTRMAMPSGGQPRRSLSGSGFGAWTTMTCDRGVRKRPRRCVDHSL